MIPKVVVVILNWNGLSDTLECLRSLQATRYSRLDILVVDNASDNDPTGPIQTGYPSTKIIRNPVNLGFAEGSNVGIRHALFEMAADYVVLLNNDTVVDENWLDSLVGVALANPQAGAVGAKIHYSDPPDRVWFAGGTFGDWRGLPGHLMHEATDRFECKQVLEVDYASGCAILLTRQALQQIGLLYSPYFVYFEETDWCARAKRAGYQVLIATQARVWHKIGASSGAVEGAFHTFYMVRNNFLFLVRNTRPVWYRPIQLGLYMIVILKRYFPLWRSGDRRQSYVGRAALLGLWHALHCQYGQYTESLDIVS